MPDADRRSEDRASNTIRWVFLFAMTGIISVVFLDMISSFLIVLVLAAIGTALADPVYRFFLGKLGGRAGLACLLTLVLATFIVVAPVVGIAGMAADQASGLVGGAVTAIEKIARDPSSLTLPDWIPFRDSIMGMLPQVTAKIGEMAGSIASFVVSSLSNLTLGTAKFFLHLFVFLYAMFIFMQMDTPIINQILSFTGLRPATQAALAERIVSVSKATIKGTLVIGVVQGALGGIGFWVAGIDGAVFWGVIMVVASIIPGIGAVAVVVCGAIYLGIQGQMAAALALGAWGALAVGTIDNLLRPILVGRDAQMNEIMILISTLGGLMMFGAVGLVLGPVLAGLFVAIWATMKESIAQQDGSAGAAPAVSPPSG